MRMSSNRNGYTMVNPEQLAAMKYPGCTTTQAVRSFCSRFKVEHVWWKPQSSGRRVLMIDVQSFWTRWSEVFGQNCDAGRTTGQGSQTPSTWRRKTTNYDAPRTKKMRTKTHTRETMTQKVRRAA